MKYKSLDGEWGTNLCGFVLKILGYQLDPVNNYRLLLIALLLYVLMRLLLLLMANKK